MEVKQYDWHRVCWSGVILWSLGWLDAVDAADQCHFKRTLSDCITMYLFSQVLQKMSNTQFSIQYLLSAGENSYVRPLTQKSPLLSK